MLVSILDSNCNNFLLFFSTETLSSIFFWRTSICFCINSMSFCNLKFWSILELISAFFLAISSSLRVLCSSILCFWKLIFSEVKSISYLVFVEISLISVIFSLTTPFMEEKIPMSNKSSIIARLSPGDNCMKGTNDAEPKITT